MTAPLAYDAERFTKATLTATPTLLFNNLTADESTLGYVHLNQAMMLPISGALSGDTVEETPVLRKESNPLFQAKLVTLGAESFFVLCSTTGIHIYDGKGKQLMHSHALPEGKTLTTAAGAELANHARGVSSSFSADGRGQICIGSVGGSIFVIDYDGVRFRTSATLTQHKAAITDLGSEVDSYRGAAPPGAEQPRPILISADDAGMVKVWGCNTSEEFCELFGVQLTAPVSAVAARGDKVIAAEISGMVSFISMTSQQVYCELRAHSRYLSAMALHPTRDVISTVSEDSTVAVWNIPREVGEEAMCVFATHWRDALLTGVAFCGDRADSLAVCAHDQLDLCVWQ
jgi:WD40 repeat protein